jgi:L-ascorbate metabolism protein UlaG (beta-lactamase superfamily)
MQSRRIIANGIPITVNSMRHFDQFGNDFSSVQNFAYIVHIGGQKILHLGDAFYNEDNFRILDLLAEEIDVLIMPTFNTLIEAEQRELVETWIAPKAIIAAHLRLQEIAAEAAAVLELYPDAIIFDQPLESVEFVPPVG